MTFFVFHGWVDSDNADASEGDGPYRLTECETEEDVSALRARHEEDLGLIGDEAERPIFRVIRGEDVAMKATKVETKWRLA